MAILSTLPQGSADFPYRRWLDGIDRFSQRSLVARCLLMQDIVHRTKLHYLKISGNSHCHNEVGPRTEARAIVVDAKTTQANLNFFDATASSADAKC